MTVKSKKRLLDLANVALLAAIGLTVGSLWLWPVDISSQAPTKTNANQIATVKVPQARPLSDYSVIHERDWRRPLQDAKVVVKAPPKKDPPKLKFTLVGTVLEPDFQYGFFRNKGGQTRIVRVGQTVDGAVVVEIKPDSAVVKKDGFEIELEVKKK